MIIGYRTPIQFRGAARKRPGPAARRRPLRAASRPATPCLIVRLGHLLFHGWGIMLTRWDFVSGVALEALRGATGRAVGAGVGGVTTGDALHVQRQ